MNQPELPYAGTSGWSGTDTSHERAVEADTSGRTARNQRAVLDLMKRRGLRGVTWKDVASDQGWHHGTASGQLSVLHKADKVMRLLQKRDGCRIYVLPEYQYGRQYDRPTVRMTQSEMFDVLSYLHRRLILSNDHGGIKFVEQQLDVYWPDWKEKL